MKVEDIIRMELLILHGDYECEKKLVKHDFKRKHREYHRAFDGENKAQILFSKEYEKLIPEPPEYKTYFYAYIDGEGYNFGSVDYEMTIEAARIEFHKRFMNSEISGIKQNRMPLVRFDIDY